MRSPTMASSISRMPLGRLTTSGTTVWGKTTSDRNGSSGSRQIPIACPSGRSPSTMICPASDRRTAQGPGLFPAGLRLARSLRTLRSACVLNS